MRQDQGTVPQQRQTPRLTIATSTMGHRLGNVALPDPVPGWDHLIVVQNPVASDLSAFKSRPDVRIVSSRETGLSRSRNAAIAHAEGDFLLFADDDITLDPRGIETALCRLLDDPSVDIVTGRLRDEAGDPFKAYPAGELRWTRINSGRVGSPEILVRLSSIRANGLGFDTDFGLGASYPCGEEYIFLCQALAKGLHARYVPADIGTHPAESTGSSWGDPVLLRARRKVLGKVFGPAALPVACVYAVRKRRQIGWRSLVNFTFDLA